LSTALTNTLFIAAQAIKNASEFLCPKAVLACLKLLDDCYQRKSKVVISGVGKSGIVGRKIAATFSSIGLMSVYINPIDALHGDIGVMHSSDICILLSNSGETDELVDFIIHIKKRGVKVISIIGNETSSIAKKSDVVLLANVEKEFCPLNLAPTASTTVALAIGDAIAIELMRSKNISVNDFAINHPAGSIGKRISLTVKDLMIPLDQINILSSEDNIKNVICEMTTNGLGICLLKNKLNKMYGIITDGDLRRALDKHSPNEWGELSACDFMTPNPINVYQDQLAYDALSLMEKEKPITLLTVVDQTKTIIGLLRMHEIIQSGIKATK
tara:strand:+ start:1560 stop:2546 length:987 start_codon:yes stop_codon:yes gene_type:complete